jgi:multidrug efflux pump subunit AcrA (membrane-fusion protein)
MKVRVFAMLAVAAIVTTGCGRGGQQHQGPPPLAVDVAKAKIGDIATYVSLDGQIAPLQDSTLSSSQSGTLASVLVNEGDRVSRGQLLAQLDDSTYRAQLAGNQATATQAQAKLRSSSIQMPISKQQYSSGLSQSQQAFQAAQNRVSTDRAALKNTELNYNSNVKLAQQGYVAQTALEASRAAFVAAQQELNNAQQALPAARAALNSAHENLQQTGVDQATIDANRAALAQAEANVQLLQTQIAQCSIYAPFDGVVTQRLLDPGAFAGPNQPIVRVSELDSVYVNANVPDENLSFVHAGTPITFTSASLPGKTFSGKIMDVNAIPTAGTLSYRARVRVPNPGDTLRGGMLVSVQIRRGYRQNVVVVPRTAIFQTDQGANVYTVVDGKAKLLPVKVGLQTDTLSEVVGNAVSAGTLVITTRPDALQNGSVVAVGGASPPPGPGASGSPKKKGQ